MKLLIVFMMLQSMKGKPFENGAVVLAADGIGHNLARVRNVAFTCDVVYDGPVKLLLGSEMAEDDGLGDACGGSYLLGGRAAKAVLRKELDGDAHNLAASLFSRK